METPGLRKGKSYSEIIALTLLFFVLAHRAAGAGSAIKIVKFFPLRTVLKVGRTVPFYAEIKAERNVENASVSLILPGEARLKRGTSPRNLGSLKKGETVSLLWEAEFLSPGRYRVSLKITCSGFSLSKAIQVEVTDKYWEEKLFLLSAYNPPYAYRGPPYEDSVFEYYKAANFPNLLWVRDEDALIEKVHKFKFTYLLDIADIVGEELLRGEPENPPPPITEDMLRKIDLAVERHRDDKYLIGYYLCDEPYETAFPNIARVIARLRKDDPERPALVNLWPYFPPEREGEKPIGDDSYVENFLQTTKAELLCYDRYIFYNGGYDEQDYYFDQIARIRKFALLYDIPFYNIVQAVGTNGTEASYLDWRTPNEAEHRWLVYTSLTYGVHGIIWFHWDHPWGVLGSPDREKIYRSLQKINREINALGPIMVHLKSTGVYHTDMSYRVEGKIEYLIENQGEGTMIVGFFRDGEGGEYFMLMNRSYKEPLRSTVLMHAPLLELEVFNVERGVWEEVPFKREGREAWFRVRLRPGGGKLYRFRAATPLPPPPIHPR